MLPLASFLFMSFLLALSFSFFYAPAFSRLRGGNSDKEITAMVRILKGNIVLLIGWNVEMMLIVKGGQEECKMTATGDQGRKDDDDEEEKRKKKNK